MEISLCCHCGIENIDIKTREQPSWDDAHTTDRRTLQAVALAESLPMVIFPDTYGGKLAALY